MTSGSLEVDSVDWMELLRGSSVEQQKMPVESSGEKLMGQNKPQTRKGL